MVLCISLVSSSDLDFRIYSLSRFGLGLFYLFLETCCDDLSYRGMLVLPNLTSKPFFCTESVFSVFTLLFLKTPKLTEMRLYTHS